MTEEMPATATQTPLERARRVVLEWLPSDGLEPDFSAAPPGPNLPPCDEEIVCRFFQRILDSGFAGDVVEVRSNGSTAYEVHWTHHGASFVGFKQPQPGKTPGEALLTGCAALLENQWCRDRLPGNSPG